MSKKIINHNVDEIIQNTLNNIKKIIDTNTIVGEPIMLGATTIIPVSKVSVGIITGAGEMNNKRSCNLPFAGGSGSGFNLTPMGFVSVTNDKVKFLPIDNSIVYSDLITAARGFVNNFAGDVNEK